MRASLWFMPTLKETPHDAEIVSHQLMLRAGLIRKLASGLYTWLPMGLKILRRVEQIIREEMNASGALELLMPVIQPAELWQETGRWDTFGGQLLTMQDNHQRHYCFGPTHEEVITDLMRQELNSYKQLPLIVYQIQTKFRDEIRPRFGVMRAREFTMKDAYSFHLSDACLQQTYTTMYSAYERILTRLGLRFRAVEADTGAIGGAVSHEFQVLADAGEDCVMYSDESDYAANLEQATSLLPPIPAADDAIPAITKVPTPEQRSITAVASYLTCAESELVKTLIVAGTDYPLVALVLRGDDSLNALKAAKHPWVKAPLQFASETAIFDELQVSIGSLGPVGLGIPLIVDHHARAMRSFICGANQDDYHLTHVVWGRDLPEPERFDLREVREGDPSPDGLGVLRSCRGIEVGHVFQLGSRYAAAMRAQVVDEKGQVQTLSMGCYGLGVSRIVAAAIEQHHDDKGIIWPASMAPFQVVLIPINANRSALVQQTAEALYEQLQAQNIDVLLDDRPERPGVLFSDHDLIGIPHRLVISERLLADGMVEYKARNQAESQLIALDAITDYIVTIAAS